MDEEYDYDGDYDYEEEPEEYVDGMEVADEKVESFIDQFRNQYEYAVDEVDYSYINSFIASGSSAENELLAFLDDLSGKNEYYEFIDTIVTNIVYNDQSIYVYTFETMDFTKEDGTNKLLEKHKKYTIVIDEYGDYQIKQIANQ